MIDTDDSEEAYQELAIKALIASFYRNNETEENRAINKMTKIFMSRLKRTMKEMDNAIEVRFVK